MFKAAFESGKFSEADKIATAVELLNKNVFLYSSPIGELQKVRSSL